MGYRDDRDAMLARLDALEAELGRAREAAEEGREARQALIEMERERDLLADEVARLRAEAEEEEEAERENRPRKSWGALAAVLALAGVAGLVGGIIQCQETAEELDGQRAAEMPPLTVESVDAAPPGQESVARRARLVHHAQLRACTDRLGGAARIALARHDDRTSRDDDELDLDVWDSLERPPEDLVAPCSELGDWPEADAAAHSALAKFVRARSRVVAARETLASYREHEAYRDDDGSGERRAYGKLRHAVSRMAHASDRLAAALDRETPAMIALVREESDDPDLVWLVEMRAAVRSLVATVAANPSSAELEEAIERALAAGEPLDEGGGERHRHLGSAYAAVIRGAKTIRERAGAVDAVEPSWRELARVIITSWQFFDSGTAHAYREADGLALP